MNIIAIDIGGTSIKYGFFTNNSLTNITEIPTQSKLGGEHIYNSVCNIIKSFGSNFTHISISTAGQVNPIDGFITYANENIPNYAGLEWKKRLELEFNVPVCVENDVNSMALGELYFGGSKGFQNILCLTYGTGVGGAIIINEKLYYGSNFSAGEFGAMVTHPKSSCDSYFSGCYEEYASTRALVNSCLKINSKYTSGRIIFEDYENPEIKLAIDNWIYEIVLGLRSLIHIFNPDCVILGGGVLSQKYVINKVNELIKLQIMSNFINTKIINAKLGNAAGLYGAVSKFYIPN